MSRDTDPSVTSATALSVVPWSMLAKVAVTSSTLYMCTGQRFIFDGSNTYTPVGGLGGIEPVRETAEGTDRDIKLWLAALSAEQLAEPFSEALFGKAVRLYRTVLSNDGRPVGSPQLCYRGKINQVEVKLADPERGDFYEVTLEKRQSREPASCYYNRETLTQAYSGDTGFDYVSRIAGFQSNWGGKDQQLSGLGASPYNYTYNWQNYV